ncbi:MAG: hypothetical protein LKF87_10120 [Clostridium tyrobutyricum]|jgi:alpha-tubulin suppressor-like RCC1 family protein|uniref:OmpL47-type beta-barrel domain-containing protein n=2 Tax=Clostridium tyrobutyricum TaxID=1519 RepID=UPI0024311581|nr:hypothetical protein [Clostridium tyrobutyricum]MCH4259305.1 hypothetical protein [Clostridium tyrobutyricum]
MNLNKWNFLSIKARRRIAASALSVAMGFSIVGSNVSTIANIAGIQTSTVKAFADEVSQTNVKKIVKVTLSGVLFLMNDGSVYAFGSNSSGSLGTGTRSLEKVHTKLSLSGVEDIFSNGISTFFKMKDGSVYACGDNYRGQLGIGSDEGNIGTPTKVNVSNITDIIYCGNSSIQAATYFKTADGSVYACGSNDSGQLGIGTTVNVSTPTKINLSNVIDVFSNNSASMLFKTSDGSVYACGSNSSGQLGLGSTSNISTPTKVNLSDVISVIQNSNSTFFKTSDGSIYACGYNSSGQLGLGTTNSVSTPTKINLSNVTDILSNNNGSMFFKTSDGSVYACGSNSTGQLGIGTTSNKSIPTKVNVSDVISIIQSNVSTFFKTSDGSIYACGYNSSGQLGIGTTSNVSTPIKVNVSNVTDVINDNNVSILFKTSDGSIYACGYNYSGQLGTGSTSNVSTPTKVNVSNIKDASIISNSVVFFIDKNNCIYSTGSNIGQFNDTSKTKTTPVNITSYMYYNTTYTIDKIYNMEDQSKYGSWFTGFYSKSLYDNNDLMQFILNNTDGTSTLSNGGVIQDESQIRDKYFLSDGSMILIDNYGMVQYYKDLTTSSPQTLPIDGSGIIGADTIVFGTGASAVKHPVLYFGSSSKYIDTDGSLKTFTLKKTDIKKMFAYKYANGISQNMLIEKSDGSLVYLDTDGHQQDFGLNMNDVSYVMPATDVNKDIFVMKDGTLRDDKGTIALPDGVTLSKIWSNRFFEMSDGFLYTLQNGTFKNTNTLAAFSKLAQNNALLLKNGNFQLADTSGNLTNNLDVSGNDVSYMSQLDSTNMYLILNDGTTYGVGTKVQGDSLENHGININDVSSFLSNGADNVTRALVTKDGTVYSNPGSWTKNTLVHFSSDAVNSAHKENPVYTNPGDVIDDYNNSGDPDLVNKLPGGTDEKDQIEDDIAPKDISAPTLNVSGNPSSWTNGDVTLSANASDESGGSGFDKIVLPDNSEITTETGTFKVIQNGTYTFKAYDKVGNVTTQTVTVSKIDKTAPGTPTISNDKGTVTITPGTDSESDVKEVDYSIDGGAYQKYTAPFTLEVGSHTVKAKTVDNAENTSSEVSEDITVSVPDKTGPNLNITGNPESWTNEDVTLTVNASDEDGGSGFDKIVLPDNSEITTATDTFKVTQNGTYTFKAYDKAGNVTTQTVTVSKIDKTAPGTPTISNDKGTVTITPGTDSESDVKEVDYSIDGGAYQKYTAPFTLEVGSHTVKAKTVDNAENTSSEVSEDITVSVPDKTGPNLNITGNPESWTNEDVTLTVNASDEDGGSGFDKIVLPDNSEITTATDTFKVTQNGTYTFKAYDKAGNVTTQTVTVSKIDKTAPGTPTISNDNGTVTITPGTDSESGVKEVDYSIDGGTYQKYTAPFTLEVGSHIVKARTVDNAENTSSEVSKDISVSVPDKTGPNLNITGNAENWTKDDVTLTVNASDEDGGSGFDKIVLPDNSEITTETGTFNVTQNGTYTFKAYDKEGNITTQTVTVSKIDKTAPGTPSISNDKGTVTITPGADSESGVKEVDYSIDGGAYQKYTAPFTLTSGNHTVKAKTVDNAGNSSSEVTENITTSDAALEEATDAVEHAEDTKKQEDLDHARDLVDALPDSSEKQDLEDRLDNVQEEIDHAAQTEQDLQDAKDEVDHAGDTLNQDDLDHAKDLVDNLPDGPEKDELENKVDDIQNQIDNKNQEEQNLAAAIAAVEKAEQTQKQDDVDSARTLVNKLPYGNDRTDLNKRLDAVQNIINLFKDAENRVQIAENVKTAGSVNSARTVVNKLPAGDRKDSLNARLDAVENAIELDNTIKAIDKDITDLNNDLDYRLRYNIQIDIESYQDKIDSLRDRVSSLPESVSDKKSEFNSRLDTIQSKLQQKQDVQDAISKVVDALNKADDSLSNEDIQAAQDAIDELPEGVDKTGYNNQLRAIKQKAQAVVAQKISDANAAVTKASRTKSLEDLNKAIELVNALPDCPQKDQLNATINIIKKFAK